MLVPDPEKEAIKLIGDLGLELNQSYQKGRYFNPSVPDKQETNAYTALSAEDVIKTLRLREEAIEAGRKACLVQHNEYRKRHSYMFTNNLWRPYKPDPKAQSWAEHLASGASFEIEPNQYRTGQNIYRANLSGNNQNKEITKEVYEEIGRDAVRKWYSQINNYNFQTHKQKDPNGEPVDSFVQVVRKNTSHLGIGIALSSDKRQVFVVCRYWSVNDDNREENVEPASDQLEIDREDLMAGCRACEAAHNEFRALHRNTNSVWMPWTPDTPAQFWAEHLANGGEFQIQPNQDNTGQNIYKASIAGRRSFTREDFEEFGRNAVKEWYSKINEYNYNNSNDWHEKEVYSFTQVVWKSVEYLGVGIAISRDLKHVYVVCRYWNMPDGQWPLTSVHYCGQNVERQISQFVPDEADFNAARVACLNAHNELRQQHTNTGSLSRPYESYIQYGRVDPKAQSWAERLAGGAVFEIQANQERTGQNIYKAPITLINRKYFEESVRDAVKEWYSQIDNYNFDTHGKKDPYGESVDSFVQVVRKATSALGVGIALSQDKKFLYVVCRYWNVDDDVRPGNVNRLKNIFELDSQVLEAGYRACLAAHNEKRAKHRNTPNFSMPYVPDTYAQQWAEHLASNDELRIQPNQSNTGQNVYKGTGAPRESFTREDLEAAGRSAVEAWYSGFYNYDFDTHDSKDGTGDVTNFTQIVWKGATKVGVGIAASRDGRSVYVVCRYWDMPHGQAPKTSGHKMSIDSSYIIEEKMTS
ncbi:Oidioi.mRNA.OKI2018_I69.chr1.g1634.t1.cds [Oikopleura dioica]|uniref:Oidioi.mRNA.OKI2018_I69.chr1.g1634.t1.cds n=1 Tax=Oikopleura dioica TaxID=34765 RepID=A0ABN7SSR8_OIKDI|nr:Oidioi.mRNA.OKI2018_I69.chr1.g1634.t1.cds [Oikopleura dioica]